MHKKKIDFKNVDTQIIYLHNIVLLEQFSFCKKPSLLFDKKSNLFTSPLIHKF